MCGLDVTPQRIEASIADLTGVIIGEFTLPTPGRSGVDAAARRRRP